MNDAPLRVFYDARTIMPGMTGVGRYTFNLLAALSRRPSLQIRAMIQPCHCDLIVQKSGIANVEWLDAPCSHESHPANEWFLWRGAHKIVQSDEVYHGPAFTIPLRNQPFARVVTIHDFFVETIPQLYPARFHYWLKAMTRSALSSANRIIFPSQAVADHATRTASKSLHYTVTHEAPDQTPIAFEAAAPQLDEQLLNNAEPYILSIGTLDKRKNPETARRAILHLKNNLQKNHAWLWLGGSAARPDGSPRNLIAEASQCGFRETGSVSGESVKEAMRRARVFVTCSLDEGFGIPLVEAMAAGCPILATDIPVHREVCGDAAEYFPVGDHIRLAELLAKIMDAPAERNSADLARAAQFSWETAAEQTEQVYRTAAETFLRSKA